MTHCRNCGLWGHMARACRSPCISYGLIAIRWSRGNKPTLRPVVHPKCDDCRQQISATPGHPLDPHVAPALPLRDSLAVYLLMVQRKDTMAFTDLVTGNYDLASKPGIITVLANELTCREKRLLLTRSFPDIWRQAEFERYKGTGPEQAMVKWQAHWPLIEAALQSATAHYPFTEFGFPKGRKDHRESALATAIREFSEETGYDRRQIQIIQRGSMFVEEFVGTDGRFYKHIYYLAGIYDQAPPTFCRRSSKQAGEISNVAWVTPVEANLLLRPYDVSKRDILQQVCRWVLNLQVGSRGCDRCRGGKFCVEHSIMINQ